MTNNTREQIRNDIFNFIKSNGIMTLASVSEDKTPWVCTVYYGIDEDMSLYFVTSPDTIHAKNINNNNKVAFNIFDSHQKIVNSKIGLQGKGLCKIIEDETENNKALLLWHQQNPGIENAITIDNIMDKSSDTKIFKVIPTFFKFFNDKLYGHHESVSLEI